ncbi:Putative phospholipase A1 precursor [Lacunisphaera limnophila]|uniref:Phosphatidylcholine 1-acylhydrolase n=1 Tax=Lacunisphaera limnophila TaxID=1838286 RepID=A0A1D8ARW9_9BACT|nr:phospholipase A [Lacunisphaera limnophila]AOS43626.1 Putative phospholipase A1 precursor [Lacunisphaera limnophila]
MTIHLPRTVLVVLTLGFLPCATDARAAPAQLTQALQSPAGPVVAGTMLEIDLLITNSGSSPATVDTPARLPLVAATPLGARAFALTRAAAESGAVMVPAGGFARMRYAMLVPLQAKGLGILAAEDDTYGRIAVEVLPAPDLSSPAPAPAAPAIAQAPGDAVTPAAITKRRPLGVLPYEPVYFSLGFHKIVNARFQLSLKFRPFGPPDEGIDLPGSFLGNLYGGFTQTSLWDLESDSKPFYDTSYKPTLLYQRHDTGRTLFGARLGYAAGIEHESNGQGGTASRSMNLLVFRPTLQWALADGWTAVFSPKLYAYIEKSEDQDLPDYRGYGDYLFYVENPDSWKLATTVRLGSSGRGSILVDGSYPLRRILGDHPPTGWAQGFIHLQYFNGYTESLRTYNLHTPWQLRLGYMLIR